jgi:hypothetical protein
MSHTITIDVGVILAREVLDNPWEDHRWRPVGVILDAPPVPGDWREHGRVGETVLYHAATLPLELHRKETPAYVVNLETGEPAVWIVLRHDPAAERPVAVHVVSASPHDVQAYGESGTETVASVPMPAPLVHLLEHFVARHHVTEPFIKRRRQPHHKPQEELFGQEPIFKRSRPAAAANPRGPGGDDAGA